MDTARHGVTSSAEIEALYRDYYRSSDLEEKRRITAADSLKHVVSLLGEDLGDVVDVGAGDGALLEEIHRTGAARSISALEISASGIDRIRGRSYLPLRRIEQFDGYSMPFGDNEFDTALSVHVVEHVEHERLLLRELGRIARRVYVEVPLEGGIRGRIDRTFGHINYYVARTFLNLIETSGLRAVRSQVLTHSKIYEQHIYGARKGAIRSNVRQTVLFALGENLAPEVMTYLFGVVAEKA